MKLAEGAPHWFHPVWIAPHASQPKNLTKVGGGIPLKILRNAQIYMRPAMR